MIDSRAPPIKKQVRNLLTVILSGIIAALLITTFFLYQYSPSGKYLVKNALIDPQNAETLAFNDYNPKTNGTSRYIFNGFLLSYYDKPSRQKKHINLSVNDYKNFFEVIKNDLSILEIPSEIEVLFNLDDIAKLTIQVRTESHAAWQDNIKTFQQVQLLPNEEYYRIELREENPTNKWVYFHHPLIYNDALNLFIPHE